MSNQFKRTDRIAETMLRTLAQIIQQEVTNPNLGLVTLSAAKVSRDLSHAKIYFTVLSDEPQQAEVILNDAASFLRSILAKAMKLRTTPQLHFVYDESIEYGKRLSRLIDEVNPTNDDDAAKE